MAMLSISIAVAAHPGTTLRHYVRGKRGVSRTKAAGKLVAAVREAKMSGESGLSTEKVPRLGNLSGKTRGFTEKSAREAKTSGETGLFTEEVPRLGDLSGKTWGFTEKSGREAKTSGESGLFTDKTITFKH